MIKEKKNAFLIVRVPLAQKEALLALAKKIYVKKDKSLSTFVREILTDYMDGQG